MTQRFDNILDEIAYEAIRSIEKHGEQQHLPIGTGDQVRFLNGAELPKPFPHVPITMGTFAHTARAVTDARSQSQGDGTVTWADILLEEVAEALAEDAPVNVRAELVQVAAVALKFIETIDTNHTDGSTT